MRNGLEILYGLVLPTMLRSSPLYLDEILVKIFCDPALQFNDVVRFERVCKFWQRTTRSKTIWRKLLARLDDEHAPDLLPQTNINRLSATEIRAVIARAYRKDMHWSSDSTVAVSPSTSREISLSAFVESARGDGAETRPRYMADYRLIPGGEYMLIHYSISGGLALNFTILHLPTGRRIWNYSDRLKARLALPVSFIATHSADDTGAILITSIVLLSNVEDGGLIDSSMPGADGSFILTLRVHLSTGQSEELFRTRIKEPFDIDTLDERNMLHTTISSGNMIVIHYSRDYMLFVDYRKSLYRWVTLGPQGTYVQRMFILDDALIGIVDVFDEGIGTVATHVVSILFERVMEDASRLDSPETQIQFIDFWDVVGFRSLPTSRPDFLCLLSIQVFKAHWRGESTTHITLLVRPEDIAPRLSSPEYRPKNGLSVVKYEWVPSQSDGLTPSIEEECGLKFVSHEEIGGYARSIPPHNLGAFSDVSLSGRCIANLPVSNKLQAFTIGALERQELEHSLPTLDINIPPECAHLLSAQALDHYSDTVHYLDHNTGVVHLHHFQ
ncbi:hypothetical protein SCHPADRAFT_573568 [Schizopora paradoxa]|uniref:F-box domain-containing protein n=1 Tax=Schizopora paradoxa TaxID=27342 RepID=A0A0H2RBP6_9AGAM|nr:hypothetical protein SCHPADRAFT_573568 [Schizopora paradoxa]